MDSKKQKAIATALRALADAVETADESAPANAEGTGKKGKAATPPSPADVANRGASAAGAGAGAPAGDIMAQCRQAAKSYAEVYGREGLKEVLSKYTQGTLADVSTDKLPELLKELS